MLTLAIILAAGKGTRFGKSEVNKTAVKFLGKSLIQMGIDNISNLVDQVCVVVGYKKETVIKSINSKKIIYVEQKQRLGTGHAVKVALKEIKKQNLKPENIIIANGDHLFMMNNITLKKLLNEHIASNNDATILSAIYDCPENMSNGRIIKKDNNVVGIIEKKDFNSHTKSIKELNSGTYVFKYKSILKVLTHAKRKNGKELYLTEVMFELNRIGSLSVSFEEVGTGVNTKQELEEVVLKNAK